MSQPAKFTLRPTVPGDERPVSDLLFASYSVLMAHAYAPATLAAALPVIARANPALLASDTYFAARTADGRLVGCGGWTPERPGRGDVVTGLGHIRHFATHPDWTGRGVGRALYEACETGARALGVRRFECYASLNAEGFYAALGFAPIGRLEISLGPEIAFPAVAMARAI